MGCAVIAHASSHLSYSPNLSCYIPAILSYLECLKSNIPSLIPGASLLVCSLLEHTLLLYFVLGKAFSFSRSQNQVFCRWNAIPDPTVWARSQPPQYPPEILFHKLSMPFTRVATQPLVTAQSTREQMRLFWIVFYSLVQKHSTCHMQDGREMRNRRLSARGKRTKRFEERVLGVCEPQERKPARAEGGPSGLQADRLRSAEPG